MPKNVHGPPARPYDNMVLIEPIVTEPSTSSTDTIITG